VGDRWKHPFKLDHAVEQVAQLRAHRFGGVVLIGIVHVGNLRFGCSGHASGRHWRRELNTGRKKPAELFEPVSRPYVLALPA
jgi:hypothetical protein